LQQSSAGVLVPLIGEAKNYERGGAQKDEYTEDEVIAVSCPLCRNWEARPLYTEHGAVGISQCSKCELVYTSPRVADPEKVYWGDENVYYQEARLVFEGSAAHHRDPNYLSEIKLIEQFKAGGRFLDVGCERGMLLRLAMKRGWEVVGVEPSPSLSNLARKHGFPVYNCFLNELPASESQQFDVVAFSDVFEHITDPLSFLNDASRFLKPGGILYVKVPNVKWSMFKQKMLAIAGRHPKRGLWDAYEHVVHYSDKTLKQMLARAGYEVLKIKVEPPIQTPNWHEYVGHYYQYPAPFFMDWKRKLVRSASYYLSRVERLLRGSSVGYLAPNIVAIAKRR
jgi:SAM-dependent methyltransferase